MLEKRICKHCGKEYTVDITLGTWQKDGTQKAGTSVGVSSKRYCCYECGKASRGEKISKIWKRKSSDEIKGIVKKRKSAIKPCICSVCGKEFIPDQAGGCKNGVHICSEECRKKRSKKIPSTGLRKCQNCGKEYMYIENQGSWNKNNELVNVNGIGHEFVVKSQRFCCYECGVAYKERKRNVSNLIKYGRISPFQDEEFRKELFEKRKKEGISFTSKGEKEISDWLESLGIKNEKYLTGNELSKDSPRIEIDVYIPDKKIGIEYNGIYYHCMNGIKKDRMTKNYHFNKTMFANENNIELIHIWEDQWINKKDVVKGIILDKLNFIDENNKIDIKNCKIEEITQENYKNFCDLYDIHGYKSAQLHLGLTFNDKIIQILSFNINKSEMEIVKDCKLPYYSIKDGFKTLFNYVKDNYDFDSAIYKLDLNIFTPNEYKTSGFEIVDYLGPNEFYIDHDYNRLKLNPKKYKEFKEKVEQNELLKCYGAGYLKLKWLK